MFDRCSIDFLPGYTPGQIHLMFVGLSVDVRWNCRTDVRSIVVGMSVDVRWKAVLRGVGRSSFRRSDVSSL